MFLTLAYCVFIVQIFIISLSIIPISIKIRRNIVEFGIRIFNNISMRIFLMIIMCIMVGLFVENFYNVSRYTELKQDLDETNMMTMVGNKCEIMLKLFRAQRNMYLTFIVNFNWIILYGIHEFINTIYVLESDKVAINVLMEALQKENNK